LTEILKRIKSLTDCACRGEVLKNQGFYQVPRPKPTSEDIERRKIRAKEWVDFRFNYLFTQKQMADVLGVSRRTIQMIEAGLVTPHPKTIRLFEALVIRYKGGKVA
jgi:DNA-binding XRE family transcriptional regulator